MASGDPTLNLGDASGTAILGGITTFLQAGGSVGKVLTASIVGVVVSPFIAIADIIAAVTTFFTAPFEGGGQAISAFFTGLMTAPLDLLAAGSEVSEAALRTFLGGTLAGIFALPVTVGVIMLSIYIIVQYLQEDETGDTIPGLPVDVPTDILGVEEEEDGADS